LAEIISEILEVDHIEEEYLYVAPSASSPRYRGCRLGVYL